VHGSRMADILYNLQHSLLGLVTINLILIV